MSPAPWPLTPSMRSSWASRFLRRRRWRAIGRVLFQAREYWPDYMSCILVVRQDLIDRRPDIVQVLVDGIARSGLWLDTSKPHREQAADFVGRFYYNQKPALFAGR